ncbi:MAG: endonuclease domain-containing protein [Saprospiraceae bacterium]
MKTNMHYGASATIFERARYLRNHPTEAEEILWHQLRNHRLKQKFRRQHPMSKYVVDFYCHALKFIIEVDGSVHDTIDQKANDLEKDFDLKNLGMEILRIGNIEIYNDIEDVVSKIYSRIKEVEEIRYKKLNNFYPSPFIRKL